MLHEVFMEVVEVSVLVNVWHIIRFGKTTTTKQPLLLVSYLLYCFTRVVVHKVFMAVVLFLWSIRQLLMVLISLISLKFSHSILDSIALSWNFWGIKIFWWGMSTISFIGIIQRICAHLFSVVWERWSSKRVVRSRMRSPFPKISDTVVLKVAALLVCFCWLVYTFLQTFIKGLEWSYISILCLTWNQWHDCWHNQSTAAVGCRLNKMCFSTTGIIYLFQVQTTKIHLIGRQWRLVNMSLWILAWQSLQWISHHWLT